MNFRPIIIAFVVSVLISACGQGSAQNTAPSSAPPIDTPTASPDGVEISSRIKFFDFDERKLGYYEDVPMHWEQLRGPGLPAMYAKGQFDLDVGHDAPPSFRLEIASGNVCYEYGHLDLTVVPDSDYAITGYIRPENLRHAGALIAVYLVDRFGTQIPGSQRVSRVVRATGDNDEEWQRVDLSLSGEYPQAFALRLQFWILQDYVWRDPNPDEVDPITRRDIYARAWFDDFSVYRLPRVTMTLSNPASIVRPDHSEEIMLDVNNATSQSLWLDVTVRDDAGREQFSQRLEARPRSAATAFETPLDNAPVDAPMPRLAAHGLPEAPDSGLRVPLPAMESGNYMAELTVTSGDQLVLRRQCHFTVLPSLPIKSPPGMEFGVDIGRWNNGDIEGPRAALIELGCGAIKIGVPMSGALNSEDKLAYYNKLLDLVRVLAEDRIETTGVILPPNARDEDPTGTTTHDLVTGGQAWKDLFGPIFAHFGVLLPAWQLGAENAELSGNADWSVDDVRQVREHLRRFISIPKIVVPQKVSAPGPTGGDVVSVWIPPEYPTSALPRALEFLAGGESSAGEWVQLGLDDGDAINEQRRLADLARRMILCKALSPNRIYLPAPLDLCEEGGTPRWEPTRDFIAYRTLFHFLSGKHAVAAVHTSPDAVLLLFQGSDSNCLVAWSWREEGDTPPIRMYLGSHPRATTLWGKTSDLPIEEGKASIPLGPVPLIIDSVDFPLALLQAGFVIEPTEIQMHEPEPRPTITFHNTYEAQLSGVLHLTPPPAWQVEPREMSFVLASGEEFTQPLTFTIPPRQVARPNELKIEMELHSPITDKLIFSEILKLDLRYIDLQASLWWEGSNLVVRQTLMNLTEQTVSFSAYCEPIGCARQERFFRNVSPGGVAVQNYVFPAARHLVGTLLPYGIEEIGGTRSLIRFAEVPQ